MIEFELQGCACKRHRFVRLLLGATNVDFTLDYSRYETGATIDRFDIVR